MKTTIEISDGLLRRAKSLARKQGTTLRSLTEEGLKKVLDERRGQKANRVQPVTFKGKGLSETYQDASWQRLRDAAYEGRGS